MADSLLLQPHEVPGIQVKGDPEICTSMNDNFFLYCANDTLYSFDSSTLANSTLPQYDPAISPAVITALAISPSKTTAAAGFSNGSVQVFDLTKNVLSKSNIQKSDFSIKNIAFLDDFTILCIDTAWILHYYSLANIKSLSSLTSYLVKGLKESFSIHLNTRVYQLLAAPVLYQKKGSVLFNNLACVTTEDTLYISKIGPSDKKEDIIVRKVNGAKATFSLQSNKSTLLCAYAAPCDISLITIAPVGNTVNRISDIIDDVPLCINFISENTLIVIFSENSCLITSISDLQGSHTTVPISGKFLQGNKSLFVFGQLQPDAPTKLYEIRMVTFENKIYAYMEKDDLENAVNLCRKAMKNDQSSISGLPKNESQKARVIEKSMSGFLKSRTQKILSEGDDLSAASQASFLINLAKELKMTDWIVADAVNIYKEANKLPIFFKLIISADPDGKLFNYNSQFAELLFENHDSLDITPFILSLPSTVVPPKRLLQYGLETKNSELLAQVYLKKLDDPLKCAMIYSHSNFSSVFDILLTYIDKSKKIEKANSLIEWVFSSTQTNKLPFIRAIIRAERTDVIDKMQHYITSFEKGNAQPKPPITFEQFVNSSIYACSLENIQSNSKVHQLLASYIVNNKINLTRTSMKYLLSRIFTENAPVNENRDDNQISEKEALLFVILSNNPDNKMLESLLPLCATYDFKNARKQILMNLKKYDVLIKDEIINEGNGKSNEGIFPFIRRLIRNSEINNDNESLFNIRKAVISNSVLLIAKDVNSFVDILFAFTTKEDEKDIKSIPPSSNLSSIASTSSIASSSSIASTSSLSSNVTSDSLLIPNQNSSKVSIQEINNELLPLLTDESFKQYYLRALLADDRGVRTRLGQKETNNYVVFLCRYFPNEVRRFIMNREDVNVIDLLEICKSRNVLDACAVIYFKVSEFDKAFKYLHEYFEKKLYSYVMSPNDSGNDEDAKNLKDALSLLSEFLTKSKVENYEVYCTMFIKSFAAPLYKVKDQPEKSAVLTDCLHTVSTLSSDRIPFDKILEIIVVEFSPLDLGVMRNTLCGVINDYDYDIDTSKSLTVLFQQDEIKAQDKYLTMSIHGTCYDSIFCGVCHGLLNEGSEDGVKLFECGHVFHNSCLTKQVCPVCNPEERIDQDIKKPTSELNQDQIFKRLKRFEYGLKRKPL